VALFRYAQSSLKLKEVAAFDAAHIKPARLSAANILHLAPRRGVALAEDATLLSGLLLLLLRCSLGTPVEIERPHRLLAERPTLLLLLLLLPMTGAPSTGR
jgi:hypothetical protein